MKSILQSPLSLMLIVLDGHW